MQLLKTRVSESWQEICLKAGCKAFRKPKGEIIILRVISGSARGHKLKTLEGSSTRPTAERVRESVFNIIAYYIPGAKVLDLYSGTGSLGIEALSRGADSVVFVEMNPECEAIIRDNLKHTKLSDKAEIIKGEVLSVLAYKVKRTQKFDMIFMDPPYSKNIVVETMDFIAKNDIIDDNGIIIAEHSSDDIVPDNFGGLCRTDCRKYGNTMISFYRKDLKT